MPDLAPNDFLFPQIKIELRQRLSMREEAVDAFKLYSMFWSYLMQHK